MFDEEKVQVLLSKLETASDNLLYPSDSDEPFEGFFWDTDEEAPLSEARVLALLELPTDTPIRQKKLDDFFRVVTTPQEWHNEEDLDTVEKFQELVYTIRKNLTRLQVFMVGQVEIEAYVVGKAPEGFWAGLKTKVIDT